MTKFYVNGNPVENKDVNFARTFLASLQITEGKFYVRVPTQDFDESIMWNMYKFIVGDSEFIAEVTSAKKSNEIDGVVGFKVKSVLFYSYTSEVSINT